jgi:hypothetical protein
MEARDSSSPSSRMMLRSPSIAERQANEVYVELPVQLPVL